MYFECSEFVSHWVPHEFVTIYKCRYIYECQFYDNALPSIMLHYEGSEFVSPMNKEVYFL